jgi:hypothetical protein
LINISYNILSNDFNIVKDDPLLYKANQNIINFLRGIGHYDIQHAIIAEYKKAVHFVTFD